MGTPRKKIHRIWKWAILTAMMIQLTGTSPNANAEQVPSVPPPPTMQSTGSWYFPPIYNLPSGIASLHDGYPSGQAACDVWAARSNSNPNTPQALMYFTIPPGAVAWGWCSGYATYDAMAANNWQGFRVAALYMQNCPRGYYSNDPAMAYVSATPFTCSNINAPKQCPSVSPGEKEFTLDPGGATCSRPDQETYTLTLDQTSADLRPALAANQPTDTFQTFIATVKGDKTGVKANTPVIIRSDVTQGTGGHVHTDTIHRPKGYLYSDQTTSSCDGVQSAACIKGNTDANGQFIFTFIASQVAGNHTVTATCDVCNGGKADLAIKVAVQGLIPIPEDIDYALTDSKGNIIGAIANVHTANHFLTNQAIQKLKELAGLYVDIGSNAVLYLNDASLEEGGLLDVGSTKWSAPHSAHRKGTSLDIRAENNGPNKEGAVPAVLFQKFLDAAANNKIKLGLHCKNSTDTQYCMGHPNNRHFHVDF